jgi:hypothetical protein
VDEQLDLLRTTKPGLGNRLAELSRDLQGRATDGFYFLDTLSQFQKATGLPAESETMVSAMRWALPVFALADQKAGRFQTLFFRAGKTAFFCSFLASSSVAVGLVFFHAHWLFFGLELLLLAVALGVIKHAEHIHSHKNWLSYRYLAEVSGSFYFYHFAESTRCPFYRFVKRLLIPAWTG